MPYASLADRQACAARNYAGKRGYFADKHLRWKQANPKRYAYLGQRHTSNQRGVVFSITFEEWVGWWGADFAKRGRKNQDLSMCRYGDCGPYEMGNIYKDTNIGNKCGPRHKERDEGLHDDVPY